jgi:hypothetical protein
LPRCALPSQCVPPRRLAPQWRTIRRLYDDRFQLPIKRVRDLEVRRLLEGCRRPLRSPPTAYRQPPKGSWRWWRFGAPPFGGKWRLAVQDGPVMRACGALCRPGSCALVSRPRGATLSASLADVSGPSRETRAEKRPERWDRRRSSLGVCRRTQLRECSTRPP